MRDFLDALEKAKRDEGVDFELARSSALLSPLTIDEIREVDLANTIERTKRRVNLEIAKFLQEEGLL